ncbi:MAG: EutN/CcmL family microcompartment protein [Calditrichaeota bacterium]|nr:EutN/CcmL family microcompartment protein [Calditrichota bacterium]MCB0312337.1 EutN/CcmL family microcompartment protein [Calditrichota bacterium]MCB9086827.1 EutN/CcmL family microcompartment protein [Calditrichia bacterium]
MILGKVCGQIYSTINHPFYDHKRLLVIDRLTPEGTPAGDYLIAVDSVGAGAGETVLVIDEGNSARQVVGEAEAPLRSIVIGIVDETMLDV